MVVEYHALLGTISIVFVCLPLTILHHLLVSASQFTYHSRFAQKYFSPMEYSSYTILLSIFELISFFIFITKKELYLSLHVFSMKVLIVNTIVKFPTRDGTKI